MLIKEYNLFSKKVNALCLYSDEEHRIGLQSVSKLPQNMCAIFFKSKPETVSFHMGTVSFPIDIIFLLDNRVVKIVHNLKPNNKETFSCYSDCIIEFNGGYCKTNNIKLKDKAWIEKNMTN